MVIMRALTASQAQAWRSSRVQSAFGWDSRLATHRRSAHHRRHLRYHMATIQGGVCPDARWRRTCHTDEIRYAAAHVKGVRQILDVKTRWHRHRVLADIGMIDPDMNGRRRAFGGRSKA